LFGEFKKLNDEYLQTGQNLELLRSEEEKLKNFVTQCGGSNISGSVIK